MWGRKRKPVEVPDDTGEAQAIRREAENEMYRLIIQSPEVEENSRRLERRREINHFSRDLSLTFTRRGRA